MNVSEQIIDVINYLGEKFGVAIDWSAKEILPVIQTLCGKYIRWEIASSIMWIIVGVIFLVVGFILCKKVKIIVRNEEFDELLLICLSVITVSCLVSGIFIIFYQVSDIIKCCYFPELRVFEYIRFLIRSSNDVQ